MEENNQSLKKYTDYDTLRKEWYTAQDLLQFLQNNGYAHSMNQIVTWEKKGIIPIPKRIRYKGKLWRVYRKDSSDFGEILLALSQKTEKRVKYS